MLPLMYQAEQLGSVINKSVESKRLSLDEQIDAQLFFSMHACSLSALLVFADGPELLDALKTIIIDIEYELEKYHALDESRISVADLDIFGLIDALEVLNYLGDHRQILYKTNRLKRRLSEWDVPAYLVINRLHEFLLGTSVSLVEQDVVAKLKKASSRYRYYRNRMVQANLRLVYSVANKFRYLGLAYEDLVQEGNLGLIKAVERFDFSKGFRFSTYAHIVISQSIHLAIDKQTSLVRLPFKALRERAIVEKVRQSLEQRLGRPPGINDLDKFLSHELEHKSVHIENAVVPNASSQKIYSVPEDSELIEQYSSSEEDIKIFSLSHEGIIARALNQLGERDAYIIRMRFGIGLSKEFTLEEISQAIGLSRERIRQLATLSIEKLSRIYENESL